MQNQKECMTADLFVELLGSMRWERTEQMVAVLDAGDFWDERIVQRAAEAKYKLDFVRRMARSLRNDDGSPVFVNVKRRLPSGEGEHIYKQLMLFNLDDFRYVVQYHKSMGLHHIEQANWFARRSAEQIGKQLPLPFPSFSGNV